MNQKSKRSKYQSGGTIDAASIKAFDKEKLKAVQMDLKSKGLYRGKIDGIYGPLVERAIEGYNAKRSSQSNYELVTSDNSGSRTTASPIDVLNPDVVSYQPTSFVPWQYIKSKFIGTNDLSTQDTTIDLGKGKLKFFRVGEVVEGNTILGGDFIEDEATAQKALQYKNSDSHMKIRGKPVTIDTSRQLFYGIEGDRLKVDKINSFQNDTPVVPARFSNTFSNVGIGTRGTRDRKVLELTDKDNKLVPSYLFGPSTKMIVYNPKNSSEAEFIHGSMPYMKQAIEKFKASRNLSEVGYLALDTGRYKHFKNNPNGLTKEDFLQYTSSDLSRPISDHVGYNLVHSDYQAGGNIQTLGDSQFGSNKSRPGPNRQMIVTDTNSVYARDKALGITPIDKRTKKLQTGGDLISQLGYRNDSPFKNAPSLNINSPNISMENVSTPLYGISNQTGETKLMKPNKKYKFKNTSSVTEVPAYQKGGALDSILGAVQGIGPALGPIGMAASGVATLAPLVIDLFSGKDKTVVSASPGKYADGGEIRINPKNKGKFTAAAKRAGHGVQEHARAVLADPSATPLQKKRANFARNAAKWNHQMGGNMIDTSLFVAPQSNTRVTAHPLQQLQFPVDTSAIPIIPGLGLPAGQSNISTYLLDLDHSGFEGSGKSKSKDRFREKQYGGDLQLSNDAFQVQGNPGQVDGNKYNMGGTEVALDHNEVVSNAFVYSEDLPNPTAKESFAELAAKQEKAKGKLEKKGKIYPYDPVTQTTMKYTQSNLDALATIQENVATALGYRNPDGSTRQKYQSGGGLPYPGFDVRAFQEWYNYTPGTTNLNTLNVDNTWGPQTAAAYADMGSKYKARRIPSFGDDVQPSLNPSITDPSLTEDQRLATVDPSFEARQTFYNEEGDTPPQVGVDPNRPPLTTPTTSSDYRTPFTIGDAFQGVNVLSKFIQGFQKPEVEPTQTIGTPITQETYDPTNQLYRNQRQYQNALNRNYGSANARRGVANQLLATKLSADQDVSSQYNQMNQRARTDYQNRIAQRRGQNIQLDQYTRDLNARNRGARRNALDNAFNSLSNFGVGLNAKSQSNDVVNMLSQLYPDVSQRAISALTKEDLLKILLRNGDK